MKQDLSDYATVERFSLAKNKFQGTWPRVLCVCSVGLLRSPSIAWVLSNPPYNCNTRCAGICEAALILVDRCLIYWSDMIVCADSEHVMAVNALQEETAVKKPVFCLHLPDCYDTREPGLVSAIQLALEELPFPHYTYGQTI